MGLDVAVTSALSGLKASQEGLSVLSNNIANVNTENYSRRIIEQKSATIDGVGQGVSITAIKRKVDEFLIEGVRTTGTQTSYSGTIDEYYERIQLLLGKPGTANNVNRSIDDFFSALRSLANNPELPSLRLDAVNKAISLADKISNLTGDLQQLRYDVDRDLKNTIDTINNQIKSLYEINIALEEAGNMGTNNVALLEDRDTVLESLAKNIDFTVYYSQTGAATISTANGISLLDKNQYRIEYTPVSTVQQIINETPISQTNIGIVDKATGQLESVVQMISGGIESEITTNIRGGKIKALLEMRDVEIPRMLEQLDNLAVTIRNQVNTIHNDGAGFPPATSLQGTTSFLSTEVREFSGKVRIGLVDDNGKPVVRTDDYSPVNPLTLNLGKLNSGTGDGKPTMQTIIDEINEYFFYSPVLSRSTLGNLADIKIAATSTPLVANGTLSFDFELDNSSNLNSTFEVLGITVDNGATGLTSALPSAYNINNGVRSRTDDPLTVSFAGGSGGPYTMQVTLRVTDADGNVSTGTLDYVIDDNPTDSNVLNDRYIASTATGSASIIPSGTTQRFAQASFVDENGDAVTSAGFPGYLKITTESSSYHIVIDELDSQDLGSPTNTSITPTGRGFSHYFGLNNLFEDYPTTKTGNSINLSVRDDIATNPNLISMGEMVRSPSYVETRTVGDSSATGTLQFAANPEIGDTITLSGTVFTFVAAAATDAEITIGAGLTTTLTNIAAKLNATNSTTIGTVDSADYASNGVDTIVITHTTPGSVGNIFSFSATTATIGVSINGDAFSTGPSGLLTNGRDTTVNTIMQPHTYELGISSNQIVDRLANLTSTILNFSSAGTLPASSSTISGYAANIVSFAAGKTKQAQENYEKDQLFSDSYIARFKGTSGVNLDEELANTIIYQNSYTASARVITVTKELFAILFETLGK